jgi:hypothetical protein
VEVVDDYIRHVLEVRRSCTPTHGKRRLRPPSSTSPNPTPPAQSTVSAGKPRKVYANWRQNQEGTGGVHWGSPDDYSSGLEDDEIALAATSAPSSVPAALPAPVLPIPADANSPLSSSDDELPPLISDSDSDSDSEDDDGPSDAAIPGESLLPVVSGGAFPVLAVSTCQHLRRLVAS